MPVSRPAPSTAFAAFSSAAALLVTVSICNLLQLSLGRLGRMHQHLLFVKTNLKTPARHLGGTWRDGRFCADLDCLGKRGRAKSGLAIQVSRNARWLSKKECGEIQRPACSRVRHPGVHSLLTAARRAT